VDSELLELTKFFENYSPGLKANEAYFSDQWYRIWVKRLLTLQTFSVVYSHRLNKSKAFLLECFSDAICSFFLSHLGFYKSADHLMRSSTECLMRASLIERGYSKDLLAVKTVADLFKLFRKHASKEVGSDIDVLKKSYGVLSQAVHTSSAAHMTLCAALQGGPVRSPKKMKVQGEEAAKLLKSYVAILYMDYASPDRLRKMRPYHLQDFFLDGVRPTLKRQRQLSL
jgi:hypothetical protein